MCQTRLTTRCINCEYFHCHKHSNDHSCYPGPDSATSSGVYTGPREADEDRELYPVINMIQLPIKDSKEDSEEASEYSYYTTSESEDHETRKAENSIKEEMKVR